MEQDVVAQKLLLELIDLKILKETDEEEVWVRLRLAYAAGYDSGKTENDHRRKSIARYTLKGKLSKIYLSAKDAAMDMGVTASAIGKAAKGKYETSGGFQWRYVNLKEPNALEQIQTIEPLQSPTARPKPRIRSSRKD